MQNRLIYLASHNKLFDKIILNKRFEIIKIINDCIRKYKLTNALDIGTTKDNKNKSSNIIIKNLKNINSFKSISNQKITSNFFVKKKKISITKNLSNIIIKEFSSDLVISSATIEHVGGIKNQRKMIENVIKLSKKMFILTTPNRNHPIEFHTKIPFIHWLPNRIYRNLLKLIGLRFYSNEKNLNLLSEKDLVKLMKNYNIDYKILYVKFLYFKSNLILIGTKTKF